MIKREELSNPASCMSRADDDEMTFVLLGRDAAAPYAIRAWVEQRVRLGKNAHTDPQIVEALACADRMQLDRLTKAIARSGMTPEAFAKAYSGPEGDAIAKAKRGKR